MKPISCAHKNAQENFNARTQQWSEKEIHEKTATRKTSPIIRNTQTSAISKCARFGHFDHDCTHGWCQQNLGMQFRAEFMGLSLETQVKVASM